MKTFMTNEMSFNKLYQNAFVIPELPAIDDYLTDVPPQCNPVNYRTSVEMFLENYKYFFPLRLFEKH